MLSATAQRPSASNAATSNAAEYLTFRLGQEEYGIDILRVQEIRSYEQPTRLAHAPDFIKGVIDLRGVNFAFDRAELTAESTAILDQAVDVLNRYPALKVEVAGHTDSVGTDAYNQGLSERRAKTVYDYLTGKGIAADRLSGPNGYGEGKPIDTNDTSEGRARNRRTELVKQQ